MKSKGGEWVMGLFDWFRHKPSVVLSDKIWLTKAAKLDGLRDAIRDRSEHEAVVVAAHFPASLREVRTHLEAAGVSVQLVEGRDARRQLFESVGSGAVVAARVETLASLAPADAPASMPLPLIIFVS